MSEKDQPALYGHFWVNYNLNKHKSDDRERLLPEDEPDTELKVLRSKYEKLKERCVTLEAAVVELARGCTCTK